MGWSGRPHPRFGGQINPRFRLFIGFALVHLSTVILGANSESGVGLVSDIATIESRVYFLSPAGLIERRNGQFELVLNPPGTRLLGIASAKFREEAEVLILVGGVPGESGQIGLHRLGQTETPFVPLSDDLIYDVAFDPVNQQVALACADGNVLVGQLVDGELQSVRTRYEHTSVVRSVAFAADGTRLASASLDGLVLLADLRGDEPPIAIQDHSDKVECVIFSPDSLRVFSGSRDGKVRLHSVEGRLIRTYSKWGDLEGTRPWSRSNQILCLEFSGDGRSLFAGSSLGYLFGISLESGRSSILKQFSKPINALALDQALFVGADQLHEIDSALFSEGNP